MIRYANGYGYYDGFVYGVGDGYNYGYGDGRGYSYGYGYGFVYDYSYGYGYGDGNVYGDGDGDGDCDRCLRGGHFEAWTFVWCSGDNLDEIASNVGVIWHD